MSENIKSRNLYELWCKIDDKIRFVLVGCMNAGVSYIIFAVSLFLLGTEHYQISVILQWALSSVTSYLAQKFLVFCTTGNYLKEYIKCCSTWFVGYLLNVIILELLVKYVPINVYILQFIAIGLVSISTYVLFKYFAFKK